MPRVVALQLRLSEKFLKLNILSFLIKTGSILIIIKADSSIGKTNYTACNLAANSVLLSELGGLDMWQLGKNKKYGIVQ
jgi:hypothetical protein